jgi:hypothetical protein
VKALDLKLPALLLFAVVIALQFATIAVYSADTSNRLQYFLFGAAFLVTIAMIILQKKLFKEKAGIGKIAGSILISLFYKACEGLTLFVVFLFAIETSTDIGSNTVGSLSIAGVLCFLAIFIIVKIITKKDGVIRFTAADAVAVFIGTAPFIFSLYLILYILILIWSLA